MDTQAEFELVTKSDLLDLTMATWDRPRTTKQLLGFIARHEAAVADKTEDEFE